MSYWGQPDDVPDPEDCTVKVSKPIVACQWCSNSHVSGVECTCKKECGSGWCACPNDEREFRL